jgi:SulP family sulfate permease
VLILELSGMLALDTTGVETLDVLRRQLARRGGALLVAGARDQPLSLLRRSGFLDRVGESNVVVDLAEAQRRAAALLEAGPAVSA